MGATDSVAERAEPVDLADLQTRVQNFHDRGIVNTGIFAVNEVEALLAEVRTLRAENIALQKWAAGWRQRIEQAESALASEREQKATLWEAALAISEKAGSAPIGTPLYDLHAALDTTSEGAGDARD